MSTHDYVIANASGSAVRSDINNVLAAIVSNNSSSSEPSTKYAYMLWADTTNGILKIRNSANNGWVELLQLDGTLTMEDGAEATPGLAFRDDLNTGIWSSAADTFNISTGGTERLELGAATIFNESGADVDFRIEGDSDANLFYVDAGNDRVGIGAAPANLFHVEGSAPVIGIRDTASYSAYTNGGKIYFQGTDSDGAVKTFAGVLGVSQSSNNGQLKLQTRAGGTLYDRVTLDDAGNCGIGTTSPGRLLEVNSNTANTFIRIKSSDTGNAGFEFGDQSDTVQAAIYHNSDNNYLIINGYNNAGAVYIDPSKNVHIVDGDLKIATGGHGISFDPFDNTDTVNGSDSNLLDDYEEGRFEPNWVGATTAGNVNYTVNKGKYTKIGNRVWCNGYTVISGHGTTAPQGSWTLTNLPFSSGTDVDNVYATGSCMIDDFAFPAAMTAGSWVVTYKPANNDNMMLYYSIDGGSWAPLSASTATAFKFIWSLSYCIN